MPLEPRVLSAAPAQVLLHDAMHRRGLPLVQAKRHRQHDVASMVEHGVVVAKADVVRSNDLSFSFLTQDLARFKHLCDEHRPRSIGRGRQKMKVLPDRTTDRAWDADIVLETGP